MPYILHARISRRRRKLADSPRLWGDPLLPLLVVLAALALLTGGAVACADARSSGVSDHPTAERSGGTVRAGSRGMGGGGTPTTEERQVAAFHAVRATDAIDVTITIGDRQAVAVTAETAIVPLIATAVQDGWLTISATHSYATRSPVVVAVTVPQVTDVEASGAGRLTISGLRAAAFRIHARGSGEITAAGTVDRLTIMAAGSGALRCAALVARVVTVHASGSGRIEVQATEALAGEVAGSGDLVYIGSPTVAVAVRGSGRLTQG